MVIVGSVTWDNRAVDGQPHIVRASDARSGALRWQFDTLPRTAMIRPMHSGTPGK